jgi:hypothetical protein
LQTNRAIGSGRALRTSGTGWSRWADWTNVTSIAAKAAQSLLPRKTLIATRPTRSDATATAGFTRTTCHPLLEHAQVRKNRPVVLDDGNWCCRINATIRRERDVESREQQTRLGRRGRWRRLAAAASARGELLVPERTQLGRPHAYRCAEILARVVAIDGESLVRRHRIEVRRRRAIGRRARWRCRRRDPSGLAQQREEIIDAARRRTIADFDGVGRPLHELPDRALFIMHGRIESQLETERIRDAGRRHRIGFAAA